MIWADGMVAEGVVAVALMALLGAAFGSFLNLCIDRLPRGQSLLRPPSRCDSCGTRLRWMDLVPIVSILALRGRCRYCGVSIPWRALIVEVLTTCVFWYLGSRYGLTRLAAVLGLYLMVLIVIAFVDLERGIIPNRVVYPATVAAFVLSAFVLGGGVGPVLLGGVVGFGIMMALYLASRGGMGAGDVKLATMIGMATGFPLVVPALLIASMIGGLAAGVLMALRLKHRGDAVPFAPMLAGGALCALLWGPEIVRTWLPWSA